MPGKLEIVEEVEFEETKVADVDDVFNKAKEPVNKMVDTSNGLTNAVRNLKQLVMAEAEGEDTKPLGFAKLTLTDGALGLALTDPAGMPMAKPPKQAAGGLKRVKKKIDLVSKRLTKLKAQDDTWAVSLVKEGETAELTRGTGVEKDVKDMDRSFTKLTTRLQDLQDDLLPQVEFKAVLKEGVSQLSKADIKPKLDVNFDDVANPSVGMAWDEAKLAKSIEKKPILAKIKDAFQFLIDAIIKIFKFIPEIVKAIKDLIVSAVELPGKIKEMASSAGLGPGDILKAGSRLASNVKNLKNVPSTCNGVINNSKSIISDLKESLGGDDGAAMPEGEAAAAAMPEGEAAAMPEAAADMPAAAEAEAAAEMPAAAEAEAAPAM